MPGKIEEVNLIADKTTTGAGASHHLWRKDKTVQVKGSTSAGAGAATVDIEVSNDDSNWEVLATVTLTLGTTETSDGFSDAAAWKHIRANVKSISGTDAAVTATVATELGF